MEIERLVAGGKIFLLHPNIIRCLFRLSNLGFWYALYVDTDTKNNFYAAFVFKLSAEPIRAETWLLGEGSTRYLHGAINVAWYQHQLHDPICCPIDATKSCTNFETFGNAVHQCVR